MSKAYPTHTEQIKAAYNEDTFNFRVALTADDDIGEALNAIGLYNDFNPSTVLLAITSLTGGLIPYGIEIGREGSPVIYLHYEDVPLSPKDCTQLEYIMRGAAADEVDWNDSTDKHIILRCWWD